MKLNDYFILRNLNKAKIIKKVIDKWTKLGCKHNKGLDKYAESVYDKAIKIGKLKIKRIK